MARRTFNAASARRSATRALRLAVRTPWQRIVAVLTVFSFVLLLATAASHHHNTVLSEHDCAVCSAVSDRVADIGTTPVLAEIAAVVAYYTSAAPQGADFHSKTVLFPPGRGPPSTCV